MLWDHPSLLQGTCMPLTLVFRKLVSHYFCVWTTLSVLLLNDKCQVTYLLGIFFGFFSISEFFSLNFSYCGNLDSEPIICRLALFWQVSSEMNCNYLFLLMGAQVLFCRNEYFLVRISICQVVGSFLTYEPFPNRHWEKTMCFKNRNW